jgi:hypothetical protein
MPLGDGQLVWCDWYNVPESTSPNGAPSDFTVALRTCPAGYDPEAAGANPNLDCQSGPNGVEFTLASEDDDAEERQSTTGDTVDGAAAFGTVLPGAYVVTQVVPDDIETSFVLGCGGGGGVGPIPVFIDDEVEVDIPPGVIQTCRWFNIPDTDQAIALGTPASIAALTGTASLTLHAYSCPAGFDVSAIDANPQAMCAPAQSISFDIVDSVDDNSGYSIETDASGMGTVDQLPADTYYIEEGVRNGTTATFVWDCYDAAGSSTRTDPLKIGNSVSYELGDGEQVRCDFYNVIGGTSRVVINKHGCDYLVPAYTLDQAGLAAQCTIDTGTVNMTIVSDIYQETQPASNNPLTLASFANVPSGYMAVVEENIAGWASAIVYCGIYDENGGVVSPVAKADVRQSRSIYLDLDPGQVASCEWYNVAQGFVDVTVNKHLCPDGFDAYAASPNDLALGCTQDPGSVKFTLHDESLFYEERTITAAAPGTWTDVPSGDIRIEEVALPTGFGMPIVVCKIDFEDGSAVSGPGFQPLSGSTWTYVNLSAGQVLTCDWYNVPGGEGAVSIWKQACPPTVNVAEMTKHELDQVCQEDIPDITFDLTVSTTVGTFTDSATSTDLFRYADFPAIPRGEVTVTERPASPWDYSVVYCHTQSDTKPITGDVLVPVSEQGSITQYVDSGDWLICDWYNAYEPKNVVEVTKYTCPEGTGYDEELRFYIETCTTPSSDGIEFMLTASDGIGIGYTAGGKVVFENVPVGPVSIQERIPEEYGQPAVFCQFVLSDTPLAETPANRVDATNGYVPFFFDGPGQRFACSWFNIEEGPGEIRVDKYTCPAGYDLHAAGADPLKDCTTRTNGIPFTLSGAAAQVEATTSNGMVTFAELPYGAYTITETLPPGTASVFVLDCVGGKLGAIRPYPLSTGATLTVQLGAGEKITCSWYNVPEYEQGRLTVYKYECSTPAFVSEVDCEIFEGGQGFDLAMWNGETWDILASGTTDAAGQYTWVDLAPGEYWLDEADRDWCHMTSDWISDDGNWLNVYDAEDTIVKIYNCGSKDPGTPGKTPAKYPNTGVGPDESGPVQELPTAAPLAGLLGLLVLRPICLRKQMVTVRYDC